MRSRSPAVRIAIAQVLFFSLATPSLGQADREPSTVKDVAPGSDVKLEKPRQVVSDPRFDPYYIAFSTDSKTLACASQYEVRLFEVETLKHIATFGIDGTAPANTRIRAIAFSPNSDMLVVAEGIWLRIWRTADKKLLRMVKDGRTVNSVAFSADGKFATTGNTEGLVNVWRGDFSEKLKSLYVDRLGAFYSPLSPDGKLVFAQGVDDVFLWEHTSGSTLATLSDVQRDELASAKHLSLTDISSDGKMIALSGGRDGILVADAKSLKSLYREPKRDADKERDIERFAGRAAKFLGKSNRIVVSGGDYYIAVYSIAPEVKFEYALPPPAGKLGGMSAAVVSPNAQFLASIASIRKSDDPLAMLLDRENAFELSVWLHRLPDTQIDK